MSLLPTRTHGKPDHKPLAQLTAIGIRRLRLTQGWSIDRLAREAKVCSNSVHRSERAREPGDPHATNPSVTMIDKLAAALGVTALELLQRGGEAH